MMTMSVITPAKSGMSPSGTRLTFTVLLRCWDEPPTFVQDLRLLPRLTPRWTLVPA